MHVPTDGDLDSPTGGPLRKGEAKDGRPTGCVNELTRGLRSRNGEEAGRARGYMDRCDGGEGWGMGVCAGCAGWMLVLLCGVGWVDVV